MRRAIKELHRETADELNADHETRAEVERLLGELQQLLAGIAIMQVHPTVGALGTACLPAAGFWPSAETLYKGS